MVSNYNSHSYVTSLYGLCFRSYKFNISYLDIPSWNFSKMQLKIPFKSDTKFCHKVWFFSLLNCFSWKIIQSICDLLNHFLVTFDNRLIFSFKITSPFDYVTMFSTIIVLNSLTTASHSYCSLLIYFDMWNWFSVRSYSFPFHFIVFTILIISYCNMIIIIFHNKFIIQYSIVSLIFPPSHMNFRWWYRLHSID